MSGPPLLLLLFTTLRLTLAAPSAQPALAPRIVGGGDVPSLAAMPFMASMLVEDSSEDGLEYAGCGGAIVSPTRILTAAHCVWDHDLAKDKLWVRVGSLKHEGGGRLIEVKGIDPHSKYNGKKQNGDYDAAMVTLAGSLVFTDTVQAATLVRARTKLAPGQMLELAGWGATHDSILSPPAETLQYAMVQPVDQKTCRKLYQDVDRGLTDRMFCAAGKGQGFCNGDSGSPVFDHKTRVVVGLVSWSEGCAEKKHPSVFTDLANPKISRWIEDMLRGRV